MADQPRSSAAAAAIIYLIAAAGLLLETTPGGRPQRSPNPTADTFFRGISLSGDLVMRVPQNARAGKSDCEGSRRPGTQRRFRFERPEQLLSARHQEAVTTPPSPEEGGVMEKTGSQNLSLIFPPYWHFKVQVTITS